MIRLIPLPWRIGLLAALLAVLSASGYVMGRKHVRAEFNAYKAAQAVEVARIKGQQQERERQARERIADVERKAKVHEQVRERNTNDALDRMRHAYASTRGLRLAPGSTAICPADSIGTKAELLREAETLIGAIRDADKDRAGLTDAMASWPR